MSDEKKQKLNEYQKKYQEAKNSKHNNEENSFLIMDLIVYTIKSIYLDELIERKA